MLIRHIFICLMILQIRASNPSVKDDEDLFVVNVTVKNYTSTKEDQIVYVMLKLPDEELTIIGYTPLLVSPTAHHMNTMACEIPFSTESLWTENEHCGQGAQMLLYGWDRDALPFSFPQDIGIAVGKNTPYKYIVVNIHYLPIVQNDYSGNKLIFSRKRRKYLAGVVTGGPGAFALLPQKYTVKTAFSCQYRGTKLVIFAVGIHAHYWARVNSLYRMRDGNITLIAKVNPQQSRQNYLLSSRVEILDGDYLIGQCIFDNNENRTIFMGLTHNDEMCNFMAGYLYEPSDPLQMNKRVPLEYCWGNEFPHLTPLIPSDSEIPLKTQLTDVEKTDYSKTRIVPLFFYPTVLLVVLVACYFGIKFLRGFVGKNSLVANEIHGQFHRIDGFEQISQSSDGDDEI